MMHAWAVMILQSLRSFAEFMTSLNELVLRKSDSDGKILKGEELRKCCVFTQITKLDLKPIVE